LLLNQLKLSLRFQEHALLLSGIDYLLGLILLTVAEELSQDWAKVLLLSFIKELRELQSDLPLI
jgi:hypothetical protein